MENTARNESMTQAPEEIDQSRQTPESGECEIVAFSPKSRQRESMFENFVDEIDAWARHAMAQNGFADF